MPSPPKPPKPPKLPPPPPSFGNPQVFQAGRFMTMQSRRGGVASTIKGGRDLARSGAQPMVRKPGLTAQ